MLLPYPACRLDQPQRQADRKRVMELALCGAALLTISAISGPARAALATLPTAGAAVASSTVAVAAIGGGTTVIVKTNGWSAFFGGVLAAGGLALGVVDPPVGTFYSGSFTYNYPSSLLAVSEAGWMGAWGTDPSLPALPVDPQAWGSGTSVTLQGPNSAFSASVNDSVPGKVQVSFDAGTLGFAVSDPGPFNLFGVLFVATQNIQVIDLGTANAPPAGANLYVSTPGLICTPPGMVVRVACGESSTQYFELVNAPEPSTWSILSLGLAAIGAMRLRRCRLIQRLQGGGMALAMRWAMTLALLAWAPSALASPLFVAGSYSFGVDGRGGFIRDPQGNYTTFEVPGSIHTFAHGINASLQTSGYFDDAIGSHGFIRSATGFFTTFDAPGGVDTFGYALNDLGQVTGSYNDSSNNAHGFIRSVGGGFLIFDVPGSVGTEPSGINNPGAVTGEILTFNPAIGFRFHGFVRDPLGAFVMVDVPGARNSYPSGINDAGDIAGTFDEGPDRVRHGFVLLSGDDFHTFDVPGSTMTSVFGINDEGDVFGSFRDSANVGHGFIRAPDGNFFTFDVPGSTGTFAKGGKPAPEPGTLILLVSGIAGLFCARMRTRFGPPSH